jgi:hypothetical protein
MLHQVVLLALLCLGNDGFPITQASGVASVNQAVTRARASQRKRRRGHRHRAWQRRISEPRVTGSVTPPINANANATKNPPVRRHYDPILQPPEKAPTPMPTRPPADL